MLVRSVGTKCNSNINFTRRSLNFGLAKNKNDKYKLNKKNAYVNTNRLMNKYTSEQIKIINNVVNELTKYDFEDLMSDLLKYGSFGSTQASIGINYSLGKPKDVSVVFENTEAYKTDLATISLEDFTEILKIMKDLSISKNSTKEIPFNQLYNTSITNK